MLEFTKKELALLRRLRTPADIQDFLNSIPQNFEPNGDIIKSPIRVLREHSAQCIEGAILGAYILSLHGHPPLLMNLASTRNDWDHVIAPFQINGRWGALSKTNYPVLRYRDPIYVSLRELALSYFNEYFLDDGLKTLRQYSEPLNLNDFEPDWPTSEEELWGIDEELDKMKYHEIVPREVLKKLRRADRIETEAAKFNEWSHDTKRSTRNFKDWH